VYTAALELGMTPATTIPAEGEEYETPEGIYVPVNSEGAQYGEVSLRTALRKSINTATVRLGQRVGLQNVIRFAQSLGIEEDLPPVISLPLGSAEVTLLEMVRAYTAFANHGNTVQPNIISRVVDRHGTVLHSSRPNLRQVVSPETAFMVTTMLQDAVVRGTGSGVHASGYRGQVAGKTGTSDEVRDAWFIGYTPEIVTGVWTGFDSPRTIMQGGYGGTLAVPIWAEFMKKVFPNPKGSFERPPGVLRVVLCSFSGRRATPWCPAEAIGPEGYVVSSLYPEYFRAGQTPPECGIHNMMQRDYALGYTDSGQ
jgi:penicillin-binding protein 1A